MGTRVVLAAVLLVAGCAQDAPAPKRNLAAVERAVVYQVYGTATSADITFATPSGTQQRSVSLPLRTAAGPGLRGTVPPGQFLYISAQQSGENDYEASITCRIIVDSKVISENTSSGRFSIVSCKGTA